MLTILSFLVPHSPIRDNLQAIRLPLCNLVGKIVRKISDGCTFTAARYDRSITVDG